LLNKYNKKYSGNKKIYGGSKKLGVHRPECPL